MYILYTYTYIYILCTHNTYIPYSHPAYINQLCRNLEGISVGYVLEIVVH